jgi:hypothetical protein
MMFNQLEAILGDFKMVLHEEVAACNQACDDMEMNDVLKQFRVLVLCNYLFSLAHTKTGAASEESLAKIRECVKAVMVKWRDLGLPMNMPKIHGVEDHLL